MVTKVPPPALEHLGQQQLGDADGGHAVGHQEQGVLLDRRLDDGVHEPRADVAPVVHDHVHPVPALEEGGHGRLHRAQVGEVHPQGQGLLAGVADRLGGLLHAAG